MKITKKQIENWRKNVQDYRDAIERVIREEKEKGRDTQYLEGLMGGLDRAISAAKFNRITE